MKRPASGRSRGTGGERAATTQRATRRSFLKLVAAGSAALLTGAVAPLGRAATASSKQKRAPAASPAIRREIESQKAYVARALKAIREHDLPSGSDPAFTFSPLRPRRRRAR